MSVPCIDDRHRHINRLARITNLKRVVDRSIPGQAAGGACGFGESKSSRGISRFGQRKCISVINRFGSVSVIRTSGIRGNGLHQSACRGVIKIFHGVTAAGHQSSRSCKKTTAIRISGGVPGVAAAHRGRVCPSGVDIHAVTAGRVSDIGVSAIRADNINPPGGERVRI
jgi:hypothetical protein